MYLHYDKTLYLRSWLHPVEQSAKNAGRGHPLKPDELLYRKVKSNILATAMDNAKVDGLILEFGVGRGESIRVLGKLTDQYIDGFDSWQGPPQFRRSCQQFQIMLPSTVDGLKIAFRSLRRITINQ